MCGQRLLESEVQLWMVKHGLVRSHLIIVSKVFEFKRASVLFLSLVVVISENIAGFPA